VEEGARVVAECHVAVELEQGRVVQVVERERQEALEVPIADVGQVEAEQRRHHDRQAAPVPALAQQCHRGGPEAGVLTPLAQDRPRHHVERDEERHHGGDEVQWRPQHPAVGVVDRKVERRRDDQHDDECQDADQRRGDDRAPGQPP
jgi:hypothetical protein